MKHIKLVNVNHVRPCSLLASSLLLIYLPINTLCDTYITYWMGTHIQAFLKEPLNPNRMGAIY